MQRRTVLIAGAALLLSAACSKEEPSAGGAASAAAPAEAKDIRLNGAGATFPYPLYSKWMAEYHRARPEVQINYQSIGSGGGIRQIISETVDFGATDAPMKPEEEKKAPRKLIHIPTTVGAVAVSYNLTGVASLRLTQETLAGIFLGEITKWNDAKIAAVNENVTLPDQNVSVVYRSDGSGTTAVFTDYLAKVSSTFSESVGQGKSVKWPTGLGAKGNEGVAGQVKTTPGTIGYIELAYATQSKLPVVLLRNKAGEFVKPEIAAVTAAAEGVDMPDSLHASITDADGKDAYPISAFTYILAYETANDAAKGKALAEFLWWAVHDGQKYGTPLHYAPLPAPVVEKVEVALRALSAGGSKLLPGG